MESEITNIEHKRKSNEIQGQSPLYMILFYLVSVLVLVSMTIQYSTMNDMLLKASDGILTAEVVLTLNDAIPYDNLIYALILYALATFGFEGTRSIIMSFDLKDISEKAKNMPRYKRNRLIQMLFTFIIIGIIGGIFQMNCINNGSIKADFKLGPITAGISTFLTLLAYADFGPKLSKQVSHFVASMKQPNEADEEEDWLDDSKKEEKK